MNNNDNQNKSNNFINNESRKQNIPNNLNQNPGNFNSNMSNPNFNKTKSNQSVNPSDPKIKKGFPSKTKTSFFMTNLISAFKSKYIWCLSGIFILLNLIEQFAILISHSSFLNNFYDFVIICNIFIIIVTAIYSTYSTFKDNWSFAKLTANNQPIKEDNNRAKNIKFWQLFSICLIVQTAFIMVSILTSLIFILPSNLNTDIYLNKILLVYFLYILFEILLSSLFLFVLLLSKKVSLSFIISSLFALLIFISPFTIAFTYTKNKKSIDYPVTGSQDDSYTSIDYATLQIQEYFNYYVGSSVYNFLINNDWMTIYDQFLKLQDTNDNFTLPINDKHSVNIYANGLFDPVFLGPEGAGSAFGGQALCNLIGQMNDDLVTEYPNATYEDNFLVSYKSKKDMGKLPSEYQLSSLFDYLSKQEYKSFPGEDSTEKIQDFLSLMSDLSQNIEYIVYNNDYQMNENWRIQSLSKDEYAELDQQVGKTISPLSYGVNWFLMNAIRTSWCVDSSLVYFISNPWDRDWDENNAKFNPLYNFSVMISPPVNDPYLDGLYYNSSSYSFNRNQKVLIPEIKENNNIDQYSDGVFEDNIQSPAYYSYSESLFEHIDVVEEAIYSPVAIMLFWFLLGDTLLVISWILYIGMNSAKQKKQKSKQTKQKINDPKKSTNTNTHIKEPINYK